jgi:hypothetical protein
VLSQEVVYRLPTLLLLAVFFVPQGRSQPTPRNGVQQSQNTKPYSCEELIKAVPLLPRQRMLQLLRQRGTVCYRTAEIVDQMKRAGADEELVNFIPPPPPPPPALPPPPPPAGALTVSCKPVDCEVTIDAQPYGATQGGEMRIENLLAAKTIVGVNREGYEPQSRMIDLPAEQPSNEDFTLTLYPTAQEHFGRAVVVRMLNAIGGLLGPIRAANVILEGHVRFPGEAGSAGPWKLTVYFQLPSRATMKLRSDTGECSVSLFGESGRVNCAKRLKQTAIASTIENELRLLRECQPVMLLSEALAGQKKLSADSGDIGPLGQLALSVESAMVKYEILLNGNYLPTRIRRKISESGLEVIYSDYVTNLEGAYPKKITIRHLGEEQPAAVYEIDEVRLGAAFKDADFR